MLGRVASPKFPLAVFSMQFVDCSGIASAEITLTTLGCYVEPLGAHFGLAGIDFGTFVLLLVPWSPFGLPLGSL